MATEQLEGVIRRLRRAAAGDRAVLPDQQLLARYLGQRDEAAFEALVRRHGPMVFGVCRRVLDNVQDAEDAFQATFLVLVKKAPAIRDGELLGNWLYGVAYRTAMKARVMNHRRRVREQKAPATTPADAERERFCTELRALLDRELHALADKYRLPIVLCDLQGRSRREAAQELGWPEGTVATRLATARGLLAKRLARHGLAGGTLAVLVEELAASALVPASLVVSTVRAANVMATGQALTAGMLTPRVAALTEEVLQGTTLSKLKTATAGLVMLALLGIGPIPAESNVRPAEGPLDAAARADHPHPGRVEQADNAPSEAAREVAPDATPPTEKSPFRLELSSPPPAEDAPKDPLEKLLVRWEKTNAEWQTFAAEVQRIVWKKPAATMPASFLRGQGDTSTRGNLYVWRAGQPSRPDQDELHYSMQYLPGLTRVGPPPESYGYERYLRSEVGSFLYTSVPTEKVLRVQEIPTPSPGKIVEENFLGFLFDLRAAEVKQRFQVTYNGDSPDRPDVFHRLKIMPLGAEDRAVFAEGRVVLNAGNLLPRQLWYRRPDSSIVTWNFLKTDINVEVPIPEFLPPPLPDGWTLEQAGKK